MLSLLNPYTWLGIGLALCAAYGAGRYQQHRIEDTKHKAALYEAAVRAKTVEDGLRNDIEATHEVHTADLLKIAAERDRLATELRRRPKRLPEAARPACAGTTGAQLAEPDGQFLAGYAADAAGLQSELRACEARERRAYEALK